MLLYCGTSLDFHTFIRLMSSNTMYEWPSYIIVRKNAKLVNLSFLNKRKSFLDVTGFNVF